MYLHINDICASKDIEIFVFINTGYDRIGLPYLTRYHRIGLQYDWIWQDWPTMLLNMTILPTQFSPSGEPHRSDAPRFGIRRGCLWAARSNREDRMQSWAAPHLIMELECLWNSDEHNVGALSPPVPGDLHRARLNKRQSRALYLILCSTCLGVGPLDLRHHQL